MVDEMFDYAAPDFRYRTLRARILFVTAPKSNHLPRWCSQRQRRQVGLYGLSELKEHGVARPLPMPGPPVLRL